ncbi:hypothetical protein BDV96DRAFT_234543 [Lophiotrema nucula]|uniref:Ankyrin repeat-containing domain protein n=1 Tax=Lophiotrema nucula TaxID=690887 RepID=A0A6A5YST6_9PLEO|nr:hypothetical protein BDV96DRAFT_234543 [Lophiotrema nucula]
MLKRLWEAGVEHNKYTPETAAHSRRSLIEVASFEGYADVLQDLLDWSEEWTQDERSNALFMARRQWHHDVVAVLLRRCDFSPQDLEDGMHHTATSLRSLGKPQISMKERLLTLEEDSAIQATVLELLLDEHALKTTNDSSAILESLLAPCIFFALHRRRLEAVAQQRREPKYPGYEEWEDAFRSCDCRKKGRTEM